MTKILCIVMFCCFIFSSNEGYAQDTDLQGDSLLCANFERKEYVWDTAEGEHASPGIYARVDFQDSFYACY